MDRTPDLGHDPAHKGHWWDSHGAAGRPTDSSTDDRPVATGGERTPAPGLGTLATRRPLHTQGGRGVLCAIPVTSLQTYTRSEQKAQRRSTGQHSGTNCADHADGTSGSQEPTHTEPSAGDYSRRCQGASAYKQASSPGTRAPQMVRSQSRSLSQASGPAAGAGTAWETL